MWIYEREVTRATGEPVSPWRLRPPGRPVCLGPDAVGIDPTVAVVATVRRDFQSFPLEQAVVTTTPAGQSLVNATTLLGTSADGRDEVRRTILGLPVVVSAVAQTYTWRFGDGLAVTRPADGRPPQQEQHVYRSAGAVTASLEITYDGTFTVGSSPVVYDVQGTAVIPGPGQPLVLREARSQLEDGAVR